MATSYSPRSEEGQHNCINEKQCHSHRDSPTNIERKASTFIWQIPSLSKQKLYLLCNAYMNSEAQYIAYDVVHICMQYIDDSALIRMMKTAKNGEGFNSHFFSIGGFKFFIDLYPDGYGAEAKGFVDIFLNLASLSPIIPKISIKYNTFMDNVKRETDHTDSVASFTYNDISSCILRLFHSDIQQINSIKLTLNIKEFTVYHSLREETKDENKDNATQDEYYTHSIDIEPDVSLCCDAFLWNVHTIDDAMGNGEYYESGIFVIAHCFKFMMKIYATNDGEYDLCLCLLSLSPKIKRLCLYYRMYLEHNHNHDDDKIQSDGSVAFDSKSLHYWPHTFLTKQHMTKYTQFAVKIEISVVDVFDAEGATMAFDEYHRLQHVQHDGMITKHSTYEWNIGANDALHDMKGAKHGVHFNSECFAMHGFKWFLQFFPGGYNAESVESADLFLYLVSIPPNISYIAVKYSMILLQNGAHFYYSEQFSMDNFLTGWPSNALHQNDIQRMNQLTFRIDIDAIDVYDVDGLALDLTQIHYNHISLPLSLPTQKYLWHINDEQTLNQIRNRETKRCFMSNCAEMYGLKWYLQFLNIDKAASSDKDEEDKLCQLYICLVCLPCDLKRISFQYELIIPQLNIIHSHFEQFTEDDTIIGLSNMKKPKLSDIMQLDTITFEARIHLIDVYDTKSVNVTHKYHKASEQNIAKEITFPKQQFLWNISSKDTVQRLKSAANGSIYRSTLFWIDSFKFMMQICPNGSNPKRAGFFNWYIYAASIPPNVAKISFWYEFKLKLKDTYVNDVDCKELKVKSSSWGWGNDILSLDRIQTMDELVFVLQMAIIDLYMENGDVAHRDLYPTLTQNAPALFMIMDTCTWSICEEKEDALLRNVKNAKNKQCFTGPIFGNTDDFKWRIQFYPNGITEEFRNEVVLCIHLQQLPPNVKGISIYFELHIVETHTRWTHVSHFRRHHLSQGWETARVKFTHIKTLDTITLMATIHLIDVYDNDSNVITQKYFDMLPLHNNEEDEYLV